jgi:hypothetical protein
VVEVGGAADSTLCGGVVMSGNVSLTQVQLSFFRHGRLVRQVMTDRSGVMLDPRRGLYAVGRTVYRACGRRIGRPVRKLSHAGRTGSNFIIATSYEM